jgi:DNA replication protein DnaC
MQSLNESLNLLIKAVKKKSGGGIKTDIKRPDLVHSFELENLNLLTKEVIMGTPKLKINFLPACGYSGCSASHSQIHVRERVEFIDDLKRYDPVMIQDEEGEEVEDLSKRPLGLKVEDDGLWIPIQHRYVYSEPCPYCGRTNQFLIRFKQSGLTATAINKHLGNYEFEEDLESLAQSFANRQIRGGLIHGHTGNGKTHLLAALAREMIWRGKRVRYVSHQSLLERIKQSFDDKTDVKDPRYTWLDRVDVVFFDELGFFRMNEWGIQTTNELIHALYESNVQVLFASNLSPRQMKQKFLDIRSQSRIVEMCKDFLFEMKGNDRRGDVEGFFK